MYSFRCIILLFFFLLVTSSFVKLSFASFGWGGVGRRVKGVRRVKRV